MLKKSYFVNDTVSWLSIKYENNKPIQIDNRLWKSPYDYLKKHKRTDKNYIKALLAKFQSKRLFNNLIQIEDDVLLVDKDSVKNKIGKILTAIKWVLKYKSCDNMPKLIKNEILLKQPGQMNQSGKKEAIEIKGNLLNQNGLLVQQNNCYSKRPAGLSSAFIQKFGTKANVYKQDNRDKLGTIQLTKLNSEQTMVSCFGQLKPGKRGSKAVRENAFLNCLNSLLTYLKKENITTPIFFPFKIACGLAGGNWVSYKNMINNFAKKYSGATYIVKLS